MDFKFDISETINEFSFTKEDEKYVSDSGSYDKDIAYEKFILLTQGGSLEPKIQILVEKIINTNI